MLYGLAATVPLSSDSTPGHRYMQLDTPYARVLWSGRTLWDCSGIRQRLIAVSNNNNNNNNNVRLLNC